MAIKLLMLYFLTAKRTFLIIFIINYSSGHLAELFLAQPSKLSDHAFNFLFQGVQFFFRFQYRYLLFMLKVYALRRRLNEPPAAADAKISDARFL